MSKTKPVEFDTEIEFDANFEVHGDRRVVVVTKKTLTTPRTGRGREWSKAIKRTETQVLDVYDARKLAQAINDAFYYEAGNFQAGDTVRTLDIETEPRFFVTGRSLDEPIDGRRFFVYTQAEEFAASLVEANPEGTYVVRRTDADRFDGIISVWDAEKVGL